MMRGFEGGNLILLLLLLLFLSDSAGNFLGNIADIKLLLTLLFVPVIIDYARMTFGNTWLAFGYAALMIYIAFIKNDSLVWLLAALWLMGMFKPKKGEPTVRSTSQYEKRHVVTMDMV